MADEKRGRAKNRTNFPGKTTRVDKKTSVSSFRGRCGFNLRPNYYIIVSSNDEESTEWLTVSQTQKLITALQKHVSRINEHKGRGL